MTTGTGKQLEQAIASYLNRNSTRNDHRQGKARPPGEHIAYLNQHLMRNDQEEASQSEEETASKVFKISSRNDHRRMQDGTERILHHI